LNADLPLQGDFEQVPARWRAQSTKGDSGTEAGAYRCTGSITIARAASTQRELDAAPDPLTIDLSGVSKMDTVGAWLIYRATRDRGAKVVGASADVEGLLKQVAEADHPARVRPEEPSATIRILREIGEWVSESGKTLVGLVGFFGAVLIAFATIIRWPSASGSMPLSSGSTWSEFARSASSA
jgi:phospholipid/cholesterol/gamma-HCH transport system permease protein